MQQYCECLGVRKGRAALMDIWDEVVEVFEVRTWADFCDEMSDVSFGIGRFVAGLFNKVYVRVPGDRAHVEKINKRMEKQGCVRSERKVAAGLGCVEVYKEDIWDVLSVPCDTHGASGCPVCQ